MCNLSCRRCPLFQSNAFASVSERNSLRCPSQISWKERWSGTPGWQDDRHHWAVERLVFRHFSGADWQFWKLKSTPEEEQLTLAYTLSIRSSGGVLHLEEKRNFPLVKPCVRLEKSRKLPEPRWDLEWSYVLQMKYAAHGRHWGLGTVSCWKENVSQAAAACRWVVCCLQCVWSDMSSWE